MLYTIYTKYPLVIHGISEAHEQRLQEIWDFTEKKINYTGNPQDVVEAIYYFVFWNFGKWMLTNFSAQTGETGIKRPESIPTTFQMVEAWNEGVCLLAAACYENEESANPAFLSKISNI